MTNIKNLHTRLDMACRVPTALVFMILLLMVALPAAAQSETGGITDDDVNSIAGKLYCPVCENITLDTCGTAACDDWRYEIRLQLEQGRTEQQIIDDFVQRFGDRVVGTPQDPALRTLSLATPWILIAAALLGLAYVAVKRQKRGTADRPPEKAPGTATTYQELIEQDLKG